MATRTKSAPIVEHLTGSTPPGNGTPTFRPAADQPTTPAPDLDLGRPPVHLFRTPEQRLLDLNVAYDRAVLFWYATGSAEDAANTDEERKIVRTADEHANRILAEIQDEVQSIPARTLREIGLKARILTWSQADWWTENAAGDTRPACNLIDDILAAAGLDRIPRRDFEFRALLPGYAGPARFAKPESPAAPPLATDRQPATELQRLAGEMRRADREHERYDSIGSDQQSRDEKERADHAWDQLRTLEQHASHLEATSLQDGLVQIALAAGRVEELWAYVSGEPRDQHAAGGVYRSLHRLLYSIRGALEAATGLSGKVFDADFNMDERFNPFRPDLAGGRAVAHDAEGSDANLTAQLADQAA